MFGAPQIVALLILLQRIIEELYSSANTDRLLAEGGREAGRDFFPVMAAAHLGWIAGLFLLIAPDAAVYWPLIGFYLLLQSARYWAVITLGRYWSHRIVTLDGAPLVASGPYRYTRHPFYLVSLLETLVLPLAFGAWGLALIMTAIWAAALHYRIVLEDTVLAPRCGANRTAAQALDGGGTEDENRV